MQLFATTKQHKSQAHRLTKPECKQETSGELGRHGKRRWQAARRSAKIRQRLQQLQLLRIRNLTQQGLKATQSTGRPAGSEEILTVVQSFSCHKYYNVLQLGGSNSRCSCSSAVASNSPFFCILVSFFRSPTAHCHYFFFL